MSDEDGLYTLKYFPAEECIFYPGDICSDRRLKPSDVVILIGLFREPFREITVSFMAELAHARGSRLRQVRRNIKTLRAAGYVDGDFLRHDLAIGSVAAKQRAIEDERLPAS